MLYTRYGVCDPEQTLALLKDAEQYFWADKLYFLKTCKLYRPNTNSPWLIYRPKET